MRLALTLAACLAASPAAAYWECYPVSRPPVHLHHLLLHKHFVAHHPTLRQHQHHHRRCHVHVHCVWVDDGGPAGFGSDFGGWMGGADNDGDYAGGEGYFSGAASGTGSPDWFPLGGLGFSQYQQVDSTVNIDLPCYLPPYSQPPLEYSPTPTPVAQVPETSTWAMMGIGFALLFGFGRKHASNRLVI